MKDKNLDGIRSVILVQAILFFTTAMLYAVTSDDLNKWFSRWALSMVLLALWGIMKHIEKLKD